MTDPITGIDWSQQPPAVILREIRYGLKALEYHLAPLASVNLDVPHVTQWGPGANRSPGDCGPAALAMVLQYVTGALVSVDAVSISCGQPAGSHYTTMAQLIAGASKYGQVLKWEHPLTLDEIRRELNAGRPVIVLIHYGALEDRMDQKYIGGHFVVVVGYDGDSFLISDPDWWGPNASDGDHWRISADVLALAMGQCHLDGNRDCQGLVIR